MTRWQFYVSLIKSYLNSWPFDHSPSRCFITFLSASKLSWKKQSVFLFYLLPIFKASFGWLFVVGIFWSKCKFFKQKVASISSAPYCSSVPFLITPPRVKWNYYKQRLEERNYLLSKLSICRWGSKMSIQAKKKPNLEF